MFERFTDNARNVVFQAQEGARRLGHTYIGCEHLLLAAASAADGEPAGAVLREHGITPELIRAEIVHMIGHRPTSDPLSGLDSEALAAIGIDLDVVRARIEAAFGPDAIHRAIMAHRRDTAARRRPAWSKGPVAELTRRWRRRRGRRHIPLSPRPALARPLHLLHPGPPPRGHIPFTPRAKKSLALSLREAEALHDNYIGVQHLLLAQLAMKDGMSPRILSALGVSGESLRADILARYRKAS